MLANEERTIVMIKNGNAPMKVADVASCWSEDAHQWRYDFTRSTFENRNALALLVYNHKDVHFTEDERLRDYLRNCEAFCHTEKYEKCRKAIEEINACPLGTETLISTSLKEVFYSWFQAWLQENGFTK